MYELSLSLKDVQSSSAKQQLIDWAIDRSLAFAEAVTDSDLMSNDVASDFTGGLDVFNPAPLVFYFNVERELIEFEIQTHQLWPGCFSYSRRQIHDSGWGEAWLESSEQSQLMNTKIIVLAEGEQRGELEKKLLVEEAQNTIWIRDFNGHAFGNGLHRATNVLLHWLERAQSRVNEFPVTKMSVLDVGFGTGVLSIKAKKLGFKTVVGTEIDPALIRLGQENAALNDVNDIVFLMDDELSKCCNTTPWKGFDLVLCNVQTAAQLSLHDLFRVLVVAGGRLVVSGFMEADVPKIVESLGVRGFVLVEMASDHGWAVCEFCAVDREFPFNGEFVKQI